MGVLLMFINNLNSQNIFIQGGSNYGNQFTFRTDDPHESNDFKWGSGFSFGVCLADIPYKSNRSYTLYVGFESFGGGFDSGYSGLGGGYYKSGQFQKYVIDLEFYPWKIKLLQNLFLLPGFEINGTVGKNVSGTYSQYEMGSSIPDIDLKDYKGFVGPFNLGTNVNLTHQFKFNRFTIAPSYKFSFFLLPELNLGTFSFSHRHSLLIALGYTLK